MKVVPMEPKYLSTENGGSNHASAALSDGVGVYITQEDEYAKAISYLNGKYGDDALKDDGKPLKEYVLDNGAAGDKELANKLNLATVQKSNPWDSCDDDDNTTMNDMYIDDAFTCVGEIIIGSECDDENAGTTGDVYVDNDFTCKGQNSVIGASCDDENDQTENDEYTDINFTCVGEKIYNSVKCEGELIGSEILVDGVNYLVVDNDTIKTNLNRAETLCTSNVTDMSNLFKNNSSFNKEIGNWDTSSVIDMRRVFHYATSFNQPIGTWNISNVEKMTSMFAYATSFNQPLNWNTSNVMYMDNMFYNATSFNQPIGTWNTSNVFDMKSMFYYATSFNQPIGTWNTSNVGSMTSMFYSATSFNQDISNWNTDSLSYYEGINFATDSALTSANAPSKNGIKLETTK